MTLAPCGLAVPSQGDPEEPEGAPRALRYRKNGRVDWIIARGVRARPVICDTYDSVRRIGEANVPNVLSSAGAEKMLYKVRRG